MSSSALPEHTYGVLKVPGYHLHSKYDLVQLRKLIHHKKKKKDFALMLTPMVDMMSILVIYLIMNFTATGEAFFVGRQMEIPKAEKGKFMETFPLVSVSETEVFFDALDRRSKSGALQLQDKNDGTSALFRQTLNEIKNLQLQIRGEASKDTTLQVNLQADENLEMKHLKRVMTILVREGWTGINFIVEPTGVNR